MSSCSCIVKVIGDITLRLIDIISGIVNTHLLLITQSPTPVRISQFEGIINRPVGLNCTASKCKLILNIKLTISRCCLISNLPSGRSIISRTANLSHIVKEQVYRIFNTECHTIRCKGIVEHIIYGHNRG